jgi:hypothetical protein
MRRPAKLFEAEKAYIAQHDPCSEAESAFDNQLSRLMSSIGAIELLTLTVSIKTGIDSLGRLSELKPFLASRYTSTHKPRNIRSTPLNERWKHCGACCESDSQK